MEIDSDYTIIVLVCYDLQVFIMIYFYIQFSLYTNSIITTNFFKNFRIKIILFGKKKKKKTK